MTITRSNVEAQLSELRAFMATKAYSSLQHTLKTDIANLEASILATPPTDEPSRVHVLMLFGQKAALTEQLAAFEASCATLQDILDQMIEDDTRSTTTQIDKDNETE